MLKITDNDGMVIDETNPYNQEKFNALVDAGKYDEAEEYRVTAIEAYNIREEKENQKLLEL